MLDMSFAILTLFSSRTSIKNYIFKRYLDQSLDFFFSTCERGSKYLSTKLPQGYCNVKMRQWILKYFEVCEKLTYIISYQNDC